VISLPPRFVPKKGFPKPNRQQQALAEWRRVDLREREGAARPSEKNISDVLGKVVKDIGLDRKRSELEILKVWNNLLDPAITAHAQPANLAKGTLFVNVDNSVWLDEIVRYRRKEILDRLKTAFGPDVIRKISFRIG
jgi:predicted nucleic acid-binding Zn ribbon protein